MVFIFLVSRFAICTLVCVLAAFLFNKYATPVYMVQSSVIVTEEPQSLGSEIFDAVGMMLERMSAKTDTKLVALEFQSELEFRNHSFEQAQMHLEQAVELSPRNLFRQQKLQQLSRLNHDYERQYKSARDLLKFARHSMYEQPDLYLNLARACIDFAVSVDEDGETNRLSKQATECLSSLRSQFPDIDLKQQQLVIQARLLPSPFRVSRL